MFGRKKVEEPEVIEKPIERKPVVPVFTPSRVTTIARDVTLTGDFITNDLMEIKGNIKGNIISEGKVHVAEGGLLRGDVKATDILVDGSVDGKVIISNVAEISNTGSLQGTLETKTLVTNPQSHFDGRLSMIPERMKPHVDPIPEPDQDSSPIEY